VTRGTWHVVAASFSEDGAFEGWQRPSPGEFIASAVVGRIRSEGGFNRVMHVRGASSGGEGEGQRREGEGIVWVRVGPPRRGRELGGGGEWDMTDFEGLKAAFEYVLRPASKSGGKGRTPRPTILPKK